MGDISYHIGRQGEEHVQLSAFHGKSSISLASNMDVDSADTLSRVGHAPHFPLQLQMRFASPLQKVVASAGEDHGESDIRR